MQLLSDGMTLQDSYNAFFNRTPVAAGEATPADYTYLVDDFIETAMNYSTTALNTYNSSLGTLVSAFSQLTTLASQKSSMGVNFCTISPILLVNIQPADVACCARGVATASLS